MFTKILAPAKINLALNIVARLPNHYHLLDMVNVSCDFGDYLTITNSDKLTIEAIGKYADFTPPLSENIIFKTIQYCQAITNKEFNYHILVEKNLPVGAGLGGATSQAMAILRHICGIWGINDAIAREIAFKIGADAPYCLYGLPAHCQGIGEIINPIILPPIGAILVVFGGDFLATPLVFKHFAQNHPQIAEITINRTMQPEISDIIAWQNDLTPSAMDLCPKIREILAQLQQFQPLCARMSGSGSACFGLFADQAQAIKAQKFLAQRYDVFLGNFIY